MILSLFNTVAIYAVALQVLKSFGDLGQDDTGLMFGAILAALAVVNLAKVIFSFK